MCVMNQDSWEDFTPQHSVSTKIHKLVLSNLFSLIAGGWKKVISGKYKIYWMKVEDDAFQQHNKAQRWSEQHLSKD